MQVPFTHRQVWQGISFIPNARHAEKPKHSEKKEKDRKGRADPPPKKGGGVVWEKQNEHIGKRNCLYGGGEEAQMRGNLVPTGSCWNVPYVLPSPAAVALPGSREPALQGLKPAAGRQGRSCWASRRARLCLPAAAPAVLFQVGLESGGSSFSGLHWIVWPPIKNVQQIQPVLFVLYDVTGKNRWKCVLLGTEGVWMFPSQPSFRLLGLCFRFQMPFIERICSPVPEAFGYPNSSLLAFWSLVVLLRGHFVML